MQLKIVNQIKRKIFTYLSNYSTIGNEVEIHSSSKVFKSEMNGKIVVGQKAIIHQAHLTGNINIGNYTTLWGPNIFIQTTKTKNDYINIGKYCSIGRNTNILSYNHNINTPSSFFLNSRFFNSCESYQYDIQGPINIGNDVWIGSNVSILSNVTVGNGAVIGAGAVVTKDLLPYSISVGIPCKTIGYRFSQKEIDILNDLEWWNWDSKKIVKNEYFFSNPFSIESLKEIR